MNKRFITFEGPEGSGKTTIIKMVYDCLKEKGVDVIMTREPGGVEIAEQIRNVILNNNNTKMDARTEALLYAAARRQHLVEKVMPALEEGKVVLCDRFIDSSLAYQGYARGLGIDDVLNINRFAIDNCMPDLTILLTIPSYLVLERLAQDKERELNRLDVESLDFHTKVCDGYSLVYGRFPFRITPIIASLPLKDVFERTMGKILENLEL